VTALRADQPRQLDEFFIRLQQAVTPMNKCCFILRQMLLTQKLRDARKTRMRGAQSGSCNALREPGYEEIKGLTRSLNRRFVRRATAMLLRK
jgi:hypothetical protein